METEERRKEIETFIETGEGNPEEIAITIGMAPAEEFCEIIRDLPRYKMAIADKATTFRTTLVYEVAYKRIGYEVAVNNLKKYRKI